MTLTTINTYVTYVLLSNFILRKNHMVEPRIESILASCQALELKTEITDLY
jgi:hypothetical protein